MYIFEYFGRIFSFKHVLLKNTAFLYVRPQSEASAAIYFLLLFLLPRVSHFPGL